MEKTFWPGGAGPRSVLVARSRWWGPLHLDLATRTDATRTDPTRPNQRPHTHLALYDFFGVQSARCWKLLNLHFPVVVGSSTFMHLPASSSIFWRLAPQQDAGRCWKMLSDAGRCGEIPVDRCSCASRQRESSQRWWGGSPVLMGVLSRFSTGNLVDGRWFDGGLADPGQGIPPPHYCKPIQPPVSVQMSLSHGMHICCRPSTAPACVAWPRRPPQAQLPDKPPERAKVLESAGTANRDVSCDGGDAVCLNRLAFVVGRNSPPGDSPGGTLPMLLLQLLHTLMLLLLQLLLHCCSCCCCCCCCCAVAPARCAARRQHDIRDPPDVIVVAA
eukprot:gene13347-biopygen21553